LNASAIRDTPAIDTVGFVEIIDSSIKAANLFEGLGVTGTLRDKGLRGRKWLTMVRTKPLHHLEIKCTLEIKATYA
jgi:hypothetical protein